MRAGCEIKRPWATSRAIKMMGAAQQCVKDNKLWKILLNLSHISRAVFSLELL